MPRVSLDPYFHWLDVTTPDRPPNPYELLGLPVLESSLARIEAATRRKRELLDRFRDEADPELWSEVSAQLDAAAETLSNSSLKSILDASLRRAMAATGPWGGNVNAANSTTGTAGAGAGDAAGRRVGVNSMALQGGVSVASSAASPQGAAAGSIACVDCGAANAADRRFCSSCGKSLLAECPKCRAPHVRGEQFCGQCGINLRAYATERTQWCELRLEAAQQAQDELQFGEALGLLREVARVEDPRLDAFAREAKQRLDLYQAQRKQLERAAQVSFEEARSLLADHAIDATIAKMESVRVPLRTKEMEQLLAEATDRRDRIGRLTVEIRELIAQKNALELGPRLDRLLTLKPDHAEAKQLAGQLGGKLREAARKKIEKRDFTGALDLLRRIPTIAASDEARQLEVEAREGCWLAEHARAATLATTSHAELAQRAVESAPDNADLQRALRTAQAALRAAPREAWLAAADLAPPTGMAKTAAKSVAGCPVDWLGRSTRLVGASVEVDHTLRTQPGRWFVALGLALQGLGEASVDINLKPTVKDSVWSRLSLGKRRRETTSAWGVDIGPSAIKAVLLRWDEKSRRAHVEAAVLLEHASGAEPARDEFQLAERYTQTLEKLLEKHALQGHKLCVNLPGLNTLNRWFSMPPIAEKKLEDAIRFEARRQVAMPLEELVWDYAALETAAGKGEPSKNDAAAAGESPGRRIVFVAAKSLVVESRLAIWNRLAVKPDILQSDSVALHNWLRYELAGDEPAAYENELKDKTIALLDCGSDVTNLVFSGPRTLWYRAVGQAGDDYTRAMCRDLLLSRSDAERWKRDPRRVTHWSRLATALQPLHEQLLAEWHRSISQFQNVLPGESPARLLVLGGSAGTHGLIEHFRRVTPAIAAD
jgi:type IV pilus assembly protein PilM